MIEFKLFIDENEIILPINPPNLLIERAGNNERVEIVELGEISIPRRPKLATISIESFFPAYEGNPVTEFVNLINEAWIAKKIIRFVVTEMYQEDMTVIINSFEYDRRAGEHEDIYYTLDLIEYVAYGAKVVTIEKEKISEFSMVVRETMNKPPVGETYTVVSGDSLWAIAKRCSGNGANWTSLYNLNKEVIGNNPDLIYPGTILTLPSTWANVPVTKSKSSQTKKTVQTPSNLIDFSNVTVNVGTFAAPEEAKNAILYPDRQKTENVKKTTPNIKANMPKTGPPVWTPEHQRAQTEWFEEMKKEMAGQKDGGGGGSW